MTPPYQTISLKGSHAVSCCVTDAVLDAQRLHPRWRLAALVGMALVAAMAAGCQRSVPPNVTPPDVAAKAPPATSPTVSAKTSTSDRSKH